jgi:hypothetical protein
MAEEYGRLGLHIIPFTGIQCWAVNLSFSFQNFLYIFTHVWLNPYMNPWIQRLYCLYYWMNGEIGIDGMILKLLVLRYL